ncbi:MAG: hypothetical protein GX087_11435 [Desulfobulbaceae bacterium]|nr:hypothetical protein [Desulfobulbaceae bacterium]
MKTARITLELSGTTLEKLLFLSHHYQRSPDDLTLDLLHAAILLSTENIEQEAFGQGQLKYRRLH